ncbi:MAG: hypothetical protein ACAI35_19435 [Candidatus Methylacidiphilales bacterium]
MKSIHLILGVALAICFISAPLATSHARDEEKPEAVVNDNDPVRANGAEYPQQPWPKDFQKILANPPGDMLLYSLEPMESPEKGEETLQGFKVLGKMYMRPEQAQTAVAAFNDAIFKWDTKKAKCFKPRQALVAKDGGHTYEILLCYSCQQMFAYRDGQLVRSYGVAGSPKVLKDLLRKGDKPLSTTDPKT